MKYYLSLFETSWLNAFFRRGDIVVVKEGELIPPAIVWVGFEPPTGLRGTPILTWVEDDGSGNLEFRYTLEGSEAGFAVKARIGLPTATASIVQPGKSADCDARPSAPEKEPVLKFGAGLAETSGRSYIGWAPGGVRPTPSVQEERDLLHPPDSWWEM